jgi:prephenate dehydrogenase
MDLLVVGAGEMGRWLAETLTPRAETVTFTDSDAATAEAAARSLDGVESRAVALETGESFDVVALAVPIPAVTAAVRSHAAEATGALIDVAGVMETPIRAMERHAVSEYASFHPLFAPPRAPGRVAYVPGEAGATVGRVRSALQEAGNEVFETTAADHDAAMESVQAGAHAAVLAYALATESVDERFHTPISETLTDLVATVTAGESRVYADVQNTFDGADAVAEAAAAVAEAAAADDERFAELFADARDRVDGLEPRTPFGDERESGDVSESGNGGDSA